MTSLRSIYKAAVVVAIAAASSTSAQAQTSFVAFLNGAQEVPSIVTPAFGNGTVLLNAARTQITINLTFQGLLSPIRSAHIHNGAFGTNGGVIIDIFSLIVPSSRDFTSGAIFNATLDVTPVQANVLLAGNGYFNIHSDLNRGGEIRGQINVVPEPSTYLLMATGLGGLMVLARRRRVR